MRDGKDADDGIALVFLGGHHDSAGTILLAFLLATLCLFAPKERIADDETWLRLRVRHAMLFQVGVELV